MYPKQVIDAWLKGRSAETLAEMIDEAQIYFVKEVDTICGIIDFTDAEIIGLFIHPEYQYKGLGTELFKFAASRIKVRPFTFKATLNAVEFYTRVGCRKIGMDIVRRNDHDIYVVVMAYD